MFRLMSQAKYTCWKTIRSVLGQSLIKPDSKNAQLIDWLNFQWKLIVGKDLACISQVEKLSASTLFVIVSDERWLPALEPLRKKIITEINSRAGSTLLNRIVFQEGSIVKSALAEDKQYSLRKKNTEGTEFMIGDENLKDILNRISDKLKIVLLTTALLFVSNCTTLPVDHTFKAIDLSNSHAVSAAKKFTKKQTGDTVRDPRAYYHYLMALKAVREHQFAMAAESFRAMIRFDPSNSQIHHQLAMNLTRSGEVDSAFDALQESLDHFPDSPELNMMTGDILAGRKEYDQAITHYQRVISVQPDSARAYLLLGSIYELLKQYDLAMDMYKKTIQLEPVNPFGYHFLARINIRLGELKDAKKHLIKSLELRPNLLESREFLAWTWEKQGNIDEAKREYKLLLKLDPLTIYDRHATLAISR